MEENLFDFLLVFIVVFWGFCLTKFLFPSIIILSGNFCKAKIEVEESRELSFRKFTLKFNNLFCMVIPYYVVISILYFNFILRGRMKGISISPHILPLKPHPFTPLKRLGIPQTLIEAVENLGGFSAFM